MLEVDTTTPWDFSGGHAAFRAWAQAIHDALEGVGLVQTADTGQIDLGTVIVPANDSSGGYEIWRFDDAAQAGAPIFLRVDYMTGDSQAEARLLMQVGTGSNGSGTLSGGVATGSAHASQGGTDSSNRLIHASFNDGSFVFVGRADNVAATSYFVLLIDRLREEDGTLTDAFFVWHHGVQASPGSRLYDGVSAANAVVLPLLPSSTADLDGAAPVGEFRVSGGYRPLRSLLFMPTGFVDDGDAGTLTHEGATRAYKCLGGHLGYLGISMGGIPAAMHTSTAIAGTSLKALLRNE